MDPAKKVRYPDAIAVMRGRRSVRQFTAEEVAEEQLKIMADCARLAPTARNEQPWEFVVVRDRGKLRELAALTDYGTFIAGAAACFVVLARETKYYLEDGSAAVANLLLAAEAQGLGACWVAGDKKPYAGRVLASIGAPASMKLIALVPVGHPRETPMDVPKRSLDEVLHWEKF